MSVTTATRQDIFDRIRQIKPQLLARGVRRLALFGSFARGQQHVASDVDLLVDFAPGQKSYDNYFAICELLEDAVGRPIELLTSESLSPYIGPHILQEAEDVLLAD